MESLGREVEQEIQRVERHEEKLTTSPAKNVGLAYDAQAGWSTDPLRDQTGKLTYEITYTPPSITDVIFEPETVDIGGIYLSPRALSVSQYFTAIAFEAQTPSDAGGRVLKLTFPKNPESSRIALASATGEIFTTLDSSLDGRLFAGTKRTGVVAFEPFSAGHDSFEVLLEGSTSKKNANPDTIRIRITAPTLRSDIQTCLEQPSILEQMTAKLRATESEFNAKVAEVAAQATKKASSGCLVILLAGAGTLAVLVALLL